MSKNIVETYDLTDLIDNKNNSLCRMDNSLTKIGFFCIVNHGIEETLIENLYLSIRDFFSMENNKKFEHILNDEIKNIGYLPVGIESVSATKGDKTPHDLCEALVFSFKRDGFGNSYPENIPNMQSLVLEYKYEIETLGRKLLAIFSRALNIGSEVFTKSYEYPRLNLRFVNYPEQDLLTIHDGQLRYGAHTDYGVLTILKSEKEGLQVCDSSGNWHDVSCPKGGFIVNSGDLLSYWTGGRWKSAFHRVINPMSQSDRKSNRISMVAFFDPDRDALIEPLIECEDKINYKPVLAGEYIDSKLKKSMEL
jgi:isopenicillin N synthase-like dioxygenase